MSTLVSPAPSKASPTFRVFIAAHQDSPLPQSDDTLAVIGVGGFRPRTRLTAFTDTTGDSISKKNVHYSELTGWYWIWKNLRDVEIVGLCHYRRYFLLGQAASLKESKLYMPPTPATFALLTGPHVKEFVREALQENDVIVPRRQRLAQCMSEQYINYHSSEEWDHFIEAIEATLPDLKPRLGWFDQSFDLHAYNMMIAPRSFFDSYMTSLFAVLAYMEEKSPFRTDPYQCRVPAFIAERFFSFYLFARQVRAMEVPVVVTSPAY